MSFGTTVYEYLKSLRMNQAIRLLDDSDYNFRTISDKVGYSNSGHFAGIFKKTYTAHC
ncbi:MAG: helix-turn-helix domain-containing protein [Sporomusa sp.]